MNKIYALTAIVAGVSALTSCDDYSDRYIDEYASVVRFDTYGEQTLKVWSTDSETPYSFMVLRSGHNTNIEATAHVHAMTAEEWASYSDLYGKGHYNMLPNDCFEFIDNPTLKFDATTNYGTINLKLFNAKIGQYVSTLEPSELGEIIVCLPITLETSVGSAMSDQKNLLIIPKYEKPALTISPTGMTKVNCLPTSAAYASEYTVSLTNENTWGFTVKLNNSQNLVNRYNTENNTSYTLIQPEALEIDMDGSWKPWTDQVLNFPKGTNSISFSVRINPAKVNPMDIMALELIDSSLDFDLNASKSTSIFYVAAKPSGTRLKNVELTSLTDDGIHPVKNLYDGKSNTFFSTQTTEHDGDPVYGSYVDMKLPSAVRYFAFDYTSRHDSFGDGSGIPNDVDIYTSTDGTNWEKTGSI
ncbi:MAG: hypothetical protein K2M65_04185, partial [Muribaculaceae bacterium]|nr:hypothetical protein [Muribaculaceae bacterium]